MSEKTLAMASEVTQAAEKAMAAGDLMASLELSIVALQLIQFARLMDSASQSIRGAV